MAGDTVQRLVGGTYPDPDGGPPLDVGVRRVVIDDSLAGREAELVAGLDLGDELAVVSDPDTHAALGARVERALAAAFRVTRVALPSRPSADAETAERLREALAPGCEALVAVGAGTINDLCKHVAAETGRPYVVFATAPSMNGYTSVSASITVGALKASLPARAAAAAFFDLDVCCRAPRRLIRSGLGESMCRPTAQTDWLMSHLLLGTPYREAPFALLAEDEPALVAGAEALVRGDREVMRRLVRTLVLSGFGMTVCGGSHPASQGEHLLSHYMNMQVAAGDSFHGEQMAITTQVMAELQRRILDRDEPPRLRATSVTRADLIAHFGAELGARCWELFSAKVLSAERAEALSAELGARWDAIRGRLAAVSRSPEALREALVAAGAPVAPADLGWPEAGFRDACAHAREIRDRFTFLDLAAEAGIAVRAP